MNTLHKSITYSGKYNRPHVIVPLEDIDFILEQNPATIRLWLESIRRDQYGSRFIEFHTKLGKSAFAASRKILKDANLAEYKVDTNKQDNRKTERWLVKNLHGSRFLGYWKLGKLEATDTDLESIDMELESTTEDLKSMNMDLESIDMDCISHQTDTQQEFQNVSGSSSGSLSKRETPKEKIKNKKEKLEEQPTLDATVAHETVCYSNTEVQPNDSISDLYKPQEATPNTPNDDLVICRVLRALKTEKYRDIPKDLHNQVANNLKLLVQNYSGCELPAVAIEELYKRDLELFDEWWISNSVLDTLYSDFVSKCNDNIYRVNTEEVSTI